ncbi:hypothetical protein LX36DRAFT_329596 [Colletotrichum falcatum]|nr:hypothetical protein LX36DRAFT_329596 [Colletotrichum falcatum]
MSVVHSSSVRERQVGSGRREKERWGPSKSRKEDKTTAMECILCTPGKKHRTGPRVPAHAVRGPVIRKQVRTPAGEFGSAPPVIPASTPSLGSPFTASSIFPPVTFSHQASNASNTVHDCTHQWNQQETECDRASIICCSSIFPFLASGQRAD